MTHDQRKWLADGMRELANLGIAALVFGQLLSGQTRPYIVVLGLILGAICYIIGVRLMKFKK